MEMPKDRSLSSQRDQTVRANRNTDVNETTETSESASPSTDGFETDPIWELVAPLVRGVDSFTAAQRLKRDGFFEYARHYARQAVAENPESFEELLFLAQLLLHDGNEREETFRRLFEMNSTSVDVWYGLGVTIHVDKPAEAIPYLKATIEADPSHGMAYHNLAQSYERLGMYDEALAAYRKACKLPPPGVDIRKWSPRVSLMHMRAIEAGNPIFKPIHQESQQQPEPTSETPQEVVAPPIPESPEGETGDGETPFDSEPSTEPPESRKRTLSPEARQAMEAEFEKLIAEYERMIRGESSPTDVGNQQISDLKRSIESSPNRSDSYLELGRAYEKAGEGKKAAEVYRQARKRFPKDKRFQRTEKDGAPPRGKSESLRKRRGGARSDADKDPPSESKQ